MFKTLNPVAVKLQYDEFCRNRNVKDAEIVPFEGPDGRDCYNPSLPFTLNGKEYILCRTQQHTGMYSTVYFFEKHSDGVWRVVPDACKFEMEDPAVAVIDGKVIISGVMPFFGDGITTFTTWHTMFYVANSITDVQFLTKGPSHMKDIRLVQLANGKIGIFSRPNGEEVIRKYGYLAKIGFTVVDKLQDITADAIENAPFINNFFLPDEWGGCNGVYVLKNGLLGIVGHKSYHTDENLHYYGTAFVFNPDTREFTDMKVIISRDCFPYCEPREPRLADVTFTSGLVRHGDGTATVYSGLSDSAVGRATIEDPFIEYEK